MRVHHPLLRTLHWLPVKARIQYEIVCLCFQWLFQNDSQPCLSYLFAHSIPLNSLPGLVVKASASGPKDMWFESCLRRDFSGSNHTSDLKIGTPVAALPGFWHYMASAGTGRSGISILWLGEVESLICNFCLSVAARKLVCADLSLRCTSILLGR